MDGRPSAGVVALIVAALALVVCGPFVGLYLAVYIGFDVLALFAIDVVRQMSLAAIVVGAVAARRRDPRAGAAPRSAPAATAAVALGSVGTVVATAASVVVVVVSIVTGTGLASGLTALGWSTGGVGAGYGWGSTEICEDCEDMLLEDGVPLELGEEVEVQPGIFVTFALESDATSPTSSGAECTDGEFVIIGATVRNASDDEFDASQLWSECYVGSSWCEAVMDPALDLQGTLGYGYVPAGRPSSSGRATRCTPTTCRVPRSVSTATRGPPCRISSPRPRPDAGPRSYSGPMDILSGLGLATSSGLNAYIPLLVLGLLDRFTPVVDLGPGFEWLTNPWILGILAVLLVVEIVADKVPAVDSINDAIQTVVRPTSGGIVFGSASTAQIAGLGAETATVTDPEAFVASGTWVPVVTGIVIALVVHVSKSLTRPVANTASAGTAAPVLSSVEDVASTGLAFLAIFVPVLVLVALLAVVIGFVVLTVRARRKRRERRRAEALASGKPLVLFEGAEREGYR